MKVGIAVQCKVCGLTKQPRGRSAPLGLNLCESECPGYYESPLVGDLWPGETEEDFGYPVLAWGTKEIKEPSIDGSH